jgi:hypothetical protein
MGNCGRIKVTSLLCICILSDSNELDPLLFMNFIIFLSFAIAYVKNSNQIFSNLLFKMLANQAVNIKKFI